MKCINQHDMSDCWMCTDHNVYTTFDYFMLFAICSFIFWLEYTRCSGELHSASRLKSQTLSACGLNESYTKWSNL